MNNQTQEKERSTGMGFWEGLRKEQEEFEKQMEQEKEEEGVISELLRIQDALFAKARQPIIFTSPLVSIDEKPFIYPNTIAVISAKTGLHKSRLAEIIAASLLSRNQEPTNCIGLLASRECAVVLIDTERNVSEQLPYAIQSISRLAHGDDYEKPKNFHCISILDYQRADRFDVLHEFLQYTQEKTQGKHLVVIIDVLTDICVNFNDPKDTLPLIDLLNKTINSTNCTFVVVIHQNPSQFDNKARGHLGTEIENKASTIITLSTKEDYISIECKKQRSAKKFDMVYVRFDESRKTLVRLGAPEVEQLRATEEKQIDWKEVFAKDVALSRKELIRRIKAITNCSVSTAERKIKEAKESEEICKGSGNKDPYTLPESTQNQDILFVE